MFIWQQLLGDGTILVIIGALLMTSVAVITYLLGIFLSNNKLIAWGKKEIVQALFSVVTFWLIIVMVGLVIEPTIEQLLVGSSLSVVPKANLVINSDFKNGGVWDAAATDRKCIITKEGNDGNYLEYPVHICIGMKFLDDSSYITEQMMSYILLHYNVVKFGETFGFKSGLGTGSERIEITPLKGASIQIEMLEFIWDLLLKSLIFLRLQMVFIDLITQILFPVFLVGGIIMRSFYFTRKLGGFFIAASLSLYFVFPSMYIIGHRVLYETDNFIGINSEGNLQGKYIGYDIDKLKENAKTNMNDGSDNDIPLYAPKSWDWLEKTFDVFGEDREGGLRYITTAIKQYVRLMYQSVTLSLQLIVEDKYADEMVLTQENGVYHFTAKILVLTVVIPFISLMTTIAAIKGLGPIFGGDAEIAGLSRFL